ncbi:hypothetical protein N8I77_007958 [Diaporthe amygdali]|uniref:DUF7907 domain-containing protein n=1 Tax=Phomopsis amygdali TaxID=1214568 RepID=A0AAD9SE45_PHOAM|nr:uncharacterized protein J7T55_009638 [Diaporthe amygdali]KAJ0109306.1 hypothetical protein J7T55_009638 [Diaporthe amygdali]KAK2605085.1 hypothetical protein N8I77_007958 [Diaporthe amygdali]
MKLILSALLAFTLSAVSAQDFNTSAPFTLKLESDNDDINGQYLGACHAGAAIEQLCLDGTDGTPVNYNTFTLNVTSSGTGPLVWILQGSGFNLSSGLSFSQTLYSNLAVPWFTPSVSYDYVGFDADNKLFIYSGSYDESTFVAGQYPNATAQKPLYQWYACYTYTGYYYNALAWATTGEPINPTCEAVNVTRTFV